jgi:hypothetical protein
MKLRFSAAVSLLALACQRERGGAAPSLPPTMQTVQQEAKDAAAEDSGDVLQALKGNLLASDQAADELARGTVRCPATVVLPEATRAECIRLWWSGTESLSVTLADVGAPVEVACSRTGEVRRLTCFNVGTLNYLVGTLRTPH